MAPFFYGSRCIHCRPWRTHLRTCCQFSRHTAVLCRHDDTMSAILWLEKWIKEVSHWMSASRVKLNYQELLWAGSRHGLAVLGSSGPFLWLGTDSYSERPSSWRDTVIGPESWQAYFQHLCNMLLSASLAQTGPTFRTLEITFVTSRMDYCNTILAGAPKSITENLQRVLNAAACIVSDTHKYDYFVFYTRSCIGWMFLSECSSSCVQLSTGVCSRELHSTWWNAAFRCLTLPVGSICSLPPAVHTSPPAFDVQSSGLLCGWPGGLGLVTWHFLWSDTFVRQCSAWFKNFSFLSLLAYTAH